MKASPRTRRRGRAASRGRVLTHDQACAAARDMLVAEARLDMGTLARRLAVSRATLYRVVSSRDRLLGDVLWSFAKAALESAFDESRGETGVDRILRTGSRFRDSVLGFEQLRTFTRAEPLTTARALFTPSGGMHDRLVHAWHAILLEAMNDRLTLPIDPLDFAEIIVRLGGSMLYADLLADRPSDTDLAAVVTRAILAGEGPGDVLAAPVRLRPSGP